DRIGQKSERILCYSIAQGRSKFTTIAASCRVLALTQNIGRNEDSKLLLWPNLVAFLAADRAKPPRITCRIFIIAGHAGETLYSARSKLLLKVARRVCELGEDDNFVGRMFFSEQVEQRLKFGVGFGLPVSTALEDA